MSSSIDLELKSTEYFATLNPLARKIHQDVVETKDSYDEMWKKLSAEQQIDIINEALIKPEITLWYFDLQQNGKEETELSSEKSSLLTPLDSVTSPDTKLTPSGTLYNFDGKNLSTYSSFNPDSFGSGQRDEHAPPFSYKTKSQMNLQIFGENRSVSSPRILLSPERFSKSITTNGITVGNKVSSSVASSKGSFTASKEKSDVKFERFFNEKNNEKNGKAGFFTKFLSSVTGGATANGHGQEVDSDDMEYANLVPTKSISNYSDSDEVDLLNTSEDSQKLLLMGGGAEEEPETEECDFDLRKNFDFLNNW